MSLTEALAKLNPHDQRQIREKLLILATHSGIGRSAADNMYLESRLPEAAWDALFGALLSVGADPGEIRDAITNATRAWTLNGPAVAHAHPVTLGRAVTAVRFCQQQLVSSGRYSSISSARRALTYLLGKPPSSVARIWRSIDLGVYLMWSTFNSAFGSRPFDSLPPSATIIRGRIGLSKNQRGALLILEYTLPSHVSQRFPTIADAYAGTEWNYFFRPAPPTALYGLTMPWLEFELEEPCPEVVHKVVSTVQLSSPLKLVL
jgi:hypothetical protein